MTMTKTQDLAFAAFQTAQRVYSLPSVQANPDQRKIAAAMLTAAIDALESVADKVSGDNMRLPS